MSLQLFITNFNDDEIDDDDDETLECTEDKLLVNPNYSN